MVLRDKIGVGELMISRELKSKSMLFYVKFIKNYDESAKRLAVTNQRLLTTGSIWHCHKAGFQQ